MLSAERHAKHAEEYRYERHRPEETVLYRVVSTYWGEFRERVEVLGSLPKFVVRDIDEYSRCGIIEQWFIRVQGTDCGFERLVAFSCKRHGFCPSCLGRRMSDTAVWLTEHVIPTVHKRQRKGGFGARPTQTKESAPRAALFADSEEASHMRERRVLRDVALAFASASAHVCPRVKKTHASERR